ncbi:alpha/beta hydrolase [Flavobacterium amniphilum]|uniref:alpha/beta hydrolase family protein n=1 Tax=Flavobacterium amniphilum TaxID=1834035 RepID=UPI00202A770C|nr:alpha/beta fold hydrolase [Flavobacterium amniphilum]MCL9806003.1 alpha/beta hydrolase [Flavobacterium amniphilum]
MKKLIFAFTLFSSFVGFCQDITGTWSGELEVQGTKLPLVFNIKTEGNFLKSTLDSPKQGAKDIPVKSTLFENNTLTIDASDLGISYQGKLNNNKIEGVFKQGNMQLPLNIEKNGSQKDYTFNRPQTPKEPFNYKTEEVSFENPIDKNVLAGTISIPNDKKEFPIVVMITGSGGQNRDEELFGHKPFAVIADDFARKGIATLRLDDRGVGGSSKVEKKSTTADFATDISSAVDFLAQKGYTNIGLLGHSEGGMIAPIVATTNNKVKFIISMAGPGIKITDLMLKQIEQGGLLAGENPEKVKLDVQTSKKAFDYIINYKNNDLQKDLEVFYTNELKTYPPAFSEPKKIEEEAKNQSKTLTSPWFVYFLRFEPQDYISKIKIPVLALNGSKDFQVDAASNLEGFRKGLSKAGNKKFEVVNFEGLNHLFQECKTGAFSEYAEIEQTIAPKVLDKMSNWILKL